MTRCPCPLPEFVAAFCWPVTFAGCGPSRARGTRLSCAGCCFLLLGRVACAAELVHPRRDCSTGGVEQTRIFSHMNRMFYVSFVAHSIRRARAYNLIWLKPPERLGRGDSNGRAPSPELQKAAPAIARCASCAVFTTVVLVTGIIDSATYQHINCLLFTAFVNH